MTSNPDRYSVGWVCAIPTEYVAACELLDEQYTNDIPKIDPQRDPNLYTFGRIHEHNIVIACLPNGRYGTTSAALVAERMRASFPALRFGLLVGIAGGAPSKKHDIRLGDVVVSSPTPRHGGVFQYDYGKELGDSFEETGYLAPPPEFLLNALSFLKTKHMRYGHRIAETVKSILDNKRLRKQYSRPDPASDKLYEAGSDVLVAREDRNPDEDTPVIHYGLVASANQLMKDWRIRDALVAKHDVLCFEMEAAGILSVPCLVIRGICDYSDSHKSDEWQGYASATAAAYAKELLEIIPVRQAESQSTKGTNIENQNKFDVPFSLDGIPVTKKFVGRSNELQQMEEALLLDNRERKIFVLCGLGGIGKTQLAVKFMRIHQKRFSAIIWLDGSSEDNLKQSMARFAKRLAGGKSMMEDDKDTTAEVLEWLSLQDNNSWLLVFDNVDRDETDELAYDIRQYFPAADHGSILITTRLTQLEQLGQSQQVREVDEESAFEILSSHYKKAKDVDCRRLLRLLDGLPLAITQAGAYLQQSGMALETYLRMYEEKQIELNRIIQRAEFKLSDYPRRNVWTTWTISYEAVSKSNKFAAHILLFWSCCDRHDLWFGLFEGAVTLPQLQPALREWLGDVVEQEASFFQAIELLRSYSLIESGRNDGYSMHSVVHRWAYLYRVQLGQVELELLAFLVVVVAMPMVPTRGWSLLFHRLLPHAQACFERLDYIQSLTDAEMRFLTRENMLAGLRRLGDLFDIAGRSNDAEKILLRALEGQKGPEDVLTFETMSLLGKVYDHQRRSDEAEKMLLRALEGTEKTLGPDNLWTLDRAQDLGRHYVQRGNLVDAEKMLLRVLEGKERTQGSTHLSTVHACKTLATLYFRMNQLSKAEEMFVRARTGYDEALGTMNDWSAPVSQMLGDVYWSQGDLVKAEESFRQALTGYEAQIVEDLLMTQVVHQLAEVCAAQGKFAEAKEGLLRALAGYKKLTKPRWMVTFLTLVQISLLCLHENRLKENQENARRDTDPTTFQVMQTLSRKVGHDNPRSIEEKLCQRGLQVLRILIGDSTQAYKQIRLALKDSSDACFIKAYGLLKQWAKDTGYPVP